MRGAEDPGFRQRLDYEKQEVERIKIPIKKSDKKSGRA